MSRSSDRRGARRERRLEPVRLSAAPHRDDHHPAEAGALSLSELLGEVWLPAGGDGSIPRHPAFRPRLAGGDPDDLPPAA